jgi:PKD repeat protein
VLGRPRSCVHLGGAFFLALGLAIAVGVAPAVSAGVATGEPKTAERPAAESRPAAGPSPKRATPGKSVGSSSIKRAPAPFDQPDEAERFYVMKRSPDGVSPISTERYFQALEKMRSMPQYSTAAGAPLPSRAELARSGAKPLAILGTWSWLGPGNIGGRTRGLLIHPTSPSTMWAGGVAGGVWKTTNGGSSWAPLNDFLPNLAVTTLAMTPGNPNVIYAGTGEGWGNVDFVRGAGIMKTTDGGTTWSQLAATATSDFYYVNKILISPNSSNRVYAATRTGILRSPDGGATWTKVYSSPISVGVTDLAIRTDQTNDVILASDGSYVQATIYRNTDAGGSGTWSPVYTEAMMGRTSLAIAPSNQNVIYALSASIETGDFHGGLLAVFRSTDGGTSWNAQVRNTSSTKLNTLLLTNPLAANYVACSVGIPDKIITQGWYDNVIAVDPVNPNRVWVGGIDLFRSDDGGANWGLASYWWPPLSDTRRVHADNHAIVFHPQYNGSSNQALYVGNDGGIFRTDNAVTGSPATGSDAPCNTGNSSVFWTALNNDYGVTQFYHGLPYPNGTTYFGGAQDNGTNRGTDAAGPNAWAAIIDGDGGYVAVDPGNTNILFGETTNLSLQKSTNGGTTFASATSGITEPSSQFGFITPFVMDPANSQRLWIGGRMPWRTTDGATAWTQAGSAFTTGDFPTTAIAVAATDGNYVLFGRSSGIISRTTTGLTNTSTTVWSQVLPTPLQAYNSWLTFDPANKNVAYATYSSFGVPHVWKSTDAGATWASIDGAGSTGIPDIPVHCIVVDPGNTSRLYVGTDLGVFVSSDGGAHWSIENTDFANVVTESLAMNATSLFAFTHGRGAYRVALTSSTAPAANFSFSPPSPSAGQTVQFTDASIGGPTSWSWDFGDGFGSTTRSPTHAFSTAGAFPVMLTATNGGGSNTTTKTVTVSSAGSSSCVEDATTMCLVGGRYRIRSHWKNQYAGGTLSTLSKAKLTDVTGAFWITNSSTYEYLIRFNTATDNGRAWIAIPTFTDVEFWIDVTDTRTGQSNGYHSVAGNRTLLYDPSTFVYP